MKVTLLPPEEISWSLGAQDNCPQFYCGAGSYQRTFKVDPYPGYAHDPKLVKRLVAECHAKFSLRDAVTGLWILPFELIDRFNGLTFEDSIYHKKNGKDWKEQIVGYDGKKYDVYKQAIAIVLSGKRIPIMPAMTRYLVTHEYGHAAFYYAARKLGYRDSERDKLEAEYMKLRGVQDYVKKYKGGKWHVSPGEIIANDFRLLFMEMETEFWPHPCRRPSWDKPEGRWWQRVAKLCEVGSDPKKS